MTDLAQTLTDRAVSASAAGTPGRRRAGRLLTVLIPVAVLVVLFFLPWMGFSIPGVLPGPVNSPGSMQLLALCLVTAGIALSYDVLFGRTGLLSFGHALFFGTGAYASAVAQVAHGVNAWAALALAIVAAAAVGAFVGALAFRYGLKGSYFALVTLAFAEVFRILALSAGFTGGGVGMMLPLNESIANLQFGSRRGYVALMLGCVVAALITTAWLRHSRFGARLQAVRDNEDAARAVGVDPYRIKLGATVASAAFMGAAGAFYLQVFQYIDPGIAFGPHVSVEALVGRTTETSM